MSSSISQSIKRDLRREILPNVVDRMRSSGIKNQDDDLKEKFLKLYPNHAKPEEGLALFKYEYKALMNRRNPTVVREIFEGLNNLFTESIGEDYIEKALQTIRSDDNVSFFGDIIHAYLAVSKLTNNTVVIEEKADKHTAITQNIYLMLSENVIDPTRLTRYVYSILINSNFVETHKVPAQMIRKIEQKINEINNNNNNDNPRSFSSYPPSYPTLRDLLENTTIMNFIKNELNNLIEEFKKISNDEEVTKLQAIEKDEKKIEKLRLLLTFCDINLYGNNDITTVKDLVLKFESKKIKKTHLHERISRFLQALKDNLDKSIKDAHGPLKEFSIITYINKNIVNVEKAYIRQQQEKKSNNNIITSYSKEDLKVLAFVTASVLVNGDNNNN